VVPYVILLYLSDNLIKKSKINTLIQSYLTWPYTCVPHLLPAFFQKLTHDWHPHFSQSQRLKKGTATSRGEIIGTKGCSLSLSICSLFHFWNLQFTKEWHGALLTCFSKNNPLLYVVSGNLKWHLWHCTTLTSCRLPGPAPWWIRCSCDLHGDIDTGFVSGPL
jgi:hypothetical protein